ncbi:MAG: glycosyltransferase family 4 protein [Candidatus Omnitrophica bacterium]|nr:glycosyltransferase family 4 protein [Candidatus Omnitrophota bacterium]
MRIAIDARNLNHANRSGLQVYVDYLLKSLAAIDKDNDYYLLYASLRRKARSMPGPQAGNFTRTVMRVPDKKLPFTDAFTDFVALPAMLARNRIAVYHAPAGYTLPRFTRAKRIFTIHDLRSLKISDRTYPQDIRSLRRSAHVADVCITISEVSKKDIVEHLEVGPEKVRVVYNGVDEGFTPASEEAVEEMRRRYGLTGDYLFSVGLVPRKNIERLLKAFALLKERRELTLVLAGAGSDGPWMELYQKLAVKSGIAHRVKFLGHIPHEDLPVIYSGCSCFVFPSLYEGFGLPVLEAMRCGAAVVTSGVSALPEVGGDAALYCDPYNPEDIAAQVRRVLDDRNLCRELIQKGAARSRQFSWEKMAREIISIYRE